MSVKFTNKRGVPGDEALRTATENYQKTLDTEVAKNMEIAAIFVEGEAKRNIRKYKQEENKLIDTGRMLNSMAHEVEKTKTKVVGIVGTNLFYAPFQELGTDTIPPRPFLRPALGDNVDKVSQLIENGVNIAARKVDKR